MMPTTKEVAANFFGKLCSRDFPGGFQALSEDAT
jgi:hypothetical protein